MVSVRAFLARRAAFFGPFLLTLIGVSPGHDNRCHLRLCQHPRSPLLGSEIQLHDRATQRYRRQIRLYGRDRGAGAMQ